jgi:hypothetical protein
MRESPESIPRSPLIPGGPSGMSRSDRWLAAVGAVGALLWITGWMLSSMVDPNSGRGPGNLTEGQTRAFLNPGLVLLLPCALVFHRVQSGRDGWLGAVGAWLATAGVAGLLIGNFLEYGWWDNRITIWGFGVMFGLAYPVLVAGWALLGLTALRARALPVYLAVVPVLAALVLPVSVATGLASSDLQLRQPAFNRLLVATGIGWLAMCLGLILGPPHGARPAAQQSPHASRS